MQPTYSLEHSSHHGLLLPEESFLGLLPPSTFSFEWPLCTSLTITCPVFIFSSRQDAHISQQLPPHSATHSFLQPQNTVGCPIHLVCRETNSGTNIRVYDMLFPLRKYTLNIHTHFPMEMIYISRAYLAQFYYRSIFCWSHYHLHFIITTGKTSLPIYSPLTTTSWSTPCPLHLPSPWLLELAPVGGLNSYKISWAVEGHITYQKNIRHTDSWSPYRENMSYCSTHIPMELCYKTRACLVSYLYRFILCDTTYCSMATNTFNPLPFHLGYMAGSSSNHYSGTEMADDESDQLVHIETPRLLSSINLTIAGVEWALLKGPWCIAKGLLVTQTNINIEMKDLRRAVHLRVKLSLRNKYPNLDLLYPNLDMLSPSIYFLQIWLSPCPMEGGHKAWAYYSYDQNRSIFCVLKTSSHLEMASSSNTFASGTDMEDRGDDIHYILEYIEIPRLQSSMMLTIVGKLISSTRPTAYIIKFMGSQAWKCPKCVDVFDHGYGIYSFGQTMKIRTAIVEKKTPKRTRVSTASNSDAEDKAAANVGVVFTQLKSVAGKLKEKVYNTGYISGTGHGRSVAVVCALLVALGVAEDWKKAEEMIRERRPCISMNALHRKSLEEWSKNRLSPKRKEEAGVSSVILADNSESQRRKRS